MRAPKIKYKNKNKKREPRLDTSVPTTNHPTRAPAIHHTRTLIKLGFNTFCQRCRHCTSVRSGNDSDIFFQFLASFAFTKLRNNLSSSPVQRAFWLRLRFLAFFGLLAFLVALVVVDGLGKAGMEMEEDLGWGAVEDVTASVLGVLGEPVVGSVEAVEVALGLMATRLEWAVALMGRGGSLFPVQIYPTCSSSTI
jgi:hypothetical protein